MAPEASPVGVIPESSDAQRVTLKFATGNCSINDVESVLLRVKGVNGVDVESRPGHLVVDYSSNLVSVPKLVDALARKEGCGTSPVPNASTPTL